MRTRCSSVAAVVFITASHGAQAQEQPAPRSDAESTRIHDRAADPQHDNYPFSDYPSVHEKQWYGWQNLLAYLGSDLLVVGSVIVVWQAGEGSELIPATVATRAHAGLVVHFVHQNWGRGFASLGLNTAAGGLTVLGGFIGSRNGGYGATIVGSAIGLAMGLTTATAIDVGVLAYKDAPPAAQNRYGESIVRHLRVGAIPTPTGPVIGLSSVS